MTLPFTSGNVSGQKMSFYEHCRYRGVDGVVAACIDFYTGEVQELMRSDIPIVTIDHVFDGRIAVVSNNIQGWRIWRVYLRAGTSEDRLYPWRRFFRYQGQSVQFYRTPAGQRAGDTG